MQAIAHLVARLEIIEGIYKDFGWMLTIFWIIFQFLMSMATACCFQLYYLNYYILSIYIRALKSYVVNPNEVSSSTKSCWMLASIVNNPSKQ